MTIEPEMLAAYADGELSPEDAARVEAAMVAYPELAAQVEAHRALRAQLGAHFAPMLDAPVPERLLAAVRGSGETGTVVDFAAAKRDRAAGRSVMPPRLRWLTGGAIAASLALGLVLGSQLPGGGPIASENGRMIASGPLDRALTTQLASAGSDSPVKILLSFRDAQGRYCRGFENDAAAGIACRGDERWAIERLQAAGAGGQGTGDYRQAGSAAAAIMAAAQDMAPEGALDAQAEQAARDKLWRE